MAFTGVVQSLSASPYLAARPFLTAFFASFLGRLSYEGAIHPDGIAQFTLGVAPLLAGKLPLPLWFISNVALLVLFVLAIMEDRSGGSLTTREIFEGINTNVIKPGAGFLLTFDLVHGESAEIVEFLGRVVSPDLLAALTPHQPFLVASATPFVDFGPMQASGVLGAMSLGLAIIWALIVAGSTWFIAGMRNNIVSWIAELDDGDSLGLIKLFQFAEGGWTVVGMIVLVILPILSLLLFALTVLGLFLVQKWFERREERAKVPCAECASPMYPTAIACPRCRHRNEAPHQIGVFGQSKTALATDPGVHRLNLIARKRCPICATRLKQQAIQQQCLDCTSVTFGDIGEVNVYLRALDKKLPKTVTVCFVLGLIPLVGLVPGIVYYRLSLIASLRGYIPRSVGCLTRWGIRLVSLVLIAFQSIPLVGIIMLPLLCLLNYTVYRRVVYTGATKNLTQRTAVSPSGALTPSGTLAATPLAVVPLTVPEIQTGGVAGKNFCDTCGTQRNPAANFCMGCGKRFS